MIVKKYKNGKKVVQTTSEEFEQNIQTMPNTAISPVQPAKRKKKRFLKVKTVTKKTMPKLKKKRGCGCGK